MLTKYHEHDYPFNWVDVCEPDDNDLRNIALSLSIPDHAVIDCLQPEHLPKMEEIGENNFIIIRYFDPTCTLQHDTFQLISRKLAIFYNAQQLITIHRKKAEWLDLTADKYAQGKGITNTADMVYKLIKNALESYEQHLGALNKDIDFYESRIFLKKRIPDLLKNLYYVKRRLFMIKRIFILTKGIIDHMEKVGSNSAQYQDMKDYYIKIETITEEAYDSIVSLLNIYISLSSQRTNDVMRVLTVFSAFFLPLTFIVGIYGMNFKYMPELQSKFGYPVTMGVMVVITIFIFIGFKRKGLM